MEFQRTQYYDLMYMKTKELGYRVNCGVKKSVLKYLKLNKIEVERQAVKICENYNRSVLLI